MLNYGKIFQFHQGLSGDESYFVKDDNKDFQFHQGLSSELLLKVILASVQLSIPSRII